MNQCVKYDRDRQLTQSTLGRPSSVSSNSVVRSHPFQLPSGATGSRFAVLEDYNNDTIEVGHNYQGVPSLSSSSSQSFTEIRPPYQNISSRPGQDPSVSLRLHLLSRTIRRPTHQTSFIPTVNLKMIIFSIHWYRLNFANKMLYRLLIVFVVMWEALFKEFKTQNMIILNKNFTLHLHVVMPKGTTCLSTFSEKWSMNWATTSMTSQML